MMDWGATHEQGAVEIDVDILEVCDVEDRVDVVGGVLENDVAAIVALFKCLSDRRGIVGKVAARSFDDASWPAGFCDCRGGEKKQYQGKDGHDFFDNDVPKPK